MKNYIIILIFLLLPPSYLIGQNKFYIGQPIYIAGGADLFIENHEIKFGANIITSTAPKGFLILGENTMLTETSDAAKIVGYIRNNFPLNLNSYPVGTLLKLKTFELETNSNTEPVEIAYISTAPENPNSLAGIEEIADNGYWDINSQAHGKVTLYFTEEDLELLENNDIAAFSIAGFNGTDWELIPSTVNMESGYIQSSDFINLSGYSSYTFAISAELGTNIPKKIINIITYQQNGTIFITSDNVQIQEVVLFDMRGRNVFRKSNIHSSHVSLNGLPLSRGIHIINILTDKGVVSKKIAY